MAQSNEVVDPSLGESSTAAYAPQEPSSYGSYSSSTDPQNYNYYGYQQQQQQQQQQQHGGAYQNSGAPYQPITSFQNTGSYAGSTSYPTTYYNTGDYQTTQLYPGSGYSNQTTATWQHDPSYPSHQYSNYDSNVAHSSSTAAAPQLSYEQQYKQWADYYSQTTSNVSCAPGTENISATCTSTQNVPVSAVANDYIPLESQPPPPGTTSWRQEPSSSELPSLQAGVVTVPSDTSNGYWRHEALGFQNHHVTQTLSYSDAPAYNQTASYSPAPSYIQTPLSQAPPFTQAPALYQNSLDLNPVQYENSQNLQKTAGPHGSNSQYPTIHQIPQSYHSPMQTVSSFDTSRVNKVQIPTNLRIASNLAMGLPKTDKGSPTTTVATKPAYVSVSMPKSDSNLPSHSATDSMLKPGTFPQSLRAYVERALARCKSDLQKTACQTIMKEIITKASADGTLFTRNWDIEPLFPLPDIDSPNKDSLQNPSIVSSATKYKRSPSRRTKSRWEPMPEEKLVEKLAAVNQLPVKNVSWNHVKEREKTVSGGKFENKGGWSNAKPLHSQQQNQSKPSQKPFKKPRFGDIYKVTENGDASSDSEKEQGLTAYYSGAIALANTPEERKRRESRSKRFDKGLGQHTQIKNIRTKVVGGGNLYTKRASAFSLVLGKGAEDGGSRAVEDIDWDSLTVKGTCQEIEKRYLRLTSAPDPATVRPEEVLEKALLMVLSSPKNYLYKCDQLKSVRQDLTVQRIRNELTVRVYETHARLALEAGDLPEYNQCQSQLKILYAEGIKGCDMEFSAYNLLCVILHSNNTRDLVSSMARLSVEAKRDEAVKHALAVRAAVTSGNYVLFFRLYKTAPNLNTCLMDLYVEKMRYEAVKCMSRSYRPSVPLAFVAQVLGFLSSLPETEKKDDQTDALEECEEWLRAHGACLIGDNNGEMQLNTKASSSSLFMPEPEDAVSHGDANLAVNDFLTRSA